MNIRTLIVIFSLTIMLPASAQEEDISVKILGALSGGNAKALAAYFSSSVDVEIPGNEGTYSKSQAEGILNDFFRKNAPTKVEYVHKGASEGGSQYFIGNYTGGGVKFRFYILLKTISGQKLIHQVQFEKD